MVLPPFPTYSGIKREHLFITSKIHPRHHGYWSVLQVRAMAAVVDALPLHAVPLAAGLWHPCCQAALLAPPCAALPPQRAASGGTLLATRSMSSHGQCAGAAAAPVRAQTFKIPPFAAPQVFGEALQDLQTDYVDLMLLHYPG